MVYMGSKKDMKEKEESHKRERERRGEKEEMEKRTGCQVFYFLHPVSGSPPDL